jgi:hypothetical protein
LNIDFECFCILDGELQLRYFPLFNLHFFHRNIVFISDLDLKVIFSLRSSTPSWLICFFFRILPEKGYIITQGGCWILDLTCLLLDEDNLSGRIQRRARR